MGSRLLSIAAFTTALFCTKLVADSGSEMPIVSGVEKYWAYQAPIRPVLPTLKHEFIRNPIDAFILEGLIAEGLQPNPRAPARHLIRRAYYDLTGLPPTYDAVEAFNEQSDQSGCCHFVDVSR